MIDNELFELCKEVYKRFPEWNDTTDQIDTLSNRFVEGKGIEYYHTPLYTSDYLLEKLPNMTYVYIKHTGRAYAQNSTLAAFDYIEYADGNNAPLKALLKLVIALNDAGVKL